MSHLAANLNHTNMRSQRDKTEDKAPNLIGSPSNVYGPRALSEDILELSVRNKLLNTQPPSQKIY